MPLYNFRRDVFVNHMGLVVKAGTENFEINWPKGCPAPTKFDDFSPFYPAKPKVKGEGEGGGKPAEGHPIA